MKMVLLIVLVILIIITAMSFIPEDKTDIIENKSQLKSVNGNEQFYEKIGAIEKKSIDNKPDLSNIKKEEIITNNSIKENNISSTIEITKNIEDDKNMPKTIIIPENQLILEITDWDLFGQQKNILVTSFLVKNGFTSAIKNEKKLITCQTFNKDNKMLNEVKTILELNIKAREELILKDITIGYVDIETENINCIVSEAPAEKIFDTSLKSLKELKSENKKEYINKKESQENGGFIFENNTENKSNDDELILPKLD